MPSISRSSGLSSRAAISSWLKTSVAMRLPSAVLPPWRRELIVPAMSQRCALVTGGTGRVGGAIAARLEAEGFRTLAAGRTDGDLSRAAGARALVERAVEKLGGLDL